MRGEDADVLRNLREHGDRAAIPRPVSAWIFGSIEEMYGIAEGLVAAGWVCSPPDPYGDRYMIRAERLQDTSDAAIDAMVAEINSLIENTDAFFDGWESSVEIGQ